MVCISCPACTSKIQCVSAVQLAQVRSGVYQLSSWHKLDPVCISCPTGTSKIRCVSAVQLAQVISSVYQLSSWHKLDPVCIKSELSCRRDKGHHMQGRILLARDPLKVLAGSPRDLLKILANGSPDYFLSCQF